MNDEEKQMALFMKVSQEVAILFPQMDELLKKNTHMMNATFLCVLMTIFMEQCMRVEMSKEHVLRYVKGALEKIPDKIWEENRARSQTFNDLMYG
jgi:hypothetical protein